MSLYVVMLLYFLVGYSRCISLCHCISVYVTACPCIHLYPPVYHCDTLCECMYLHDTVCHSFSAYFTVCRYILLFCQYISSVFQFISHYAYASIFYAAVSHCIVLWHCMSLHCTVSFSHCQSQYVVRNSVTAYQWHCESMYLTLCICILDRHSAILWYCHYVTMSHCMLMWIRAIARVLLFLII